MTGKRPPALDGPDCPYCLEHIWGWWLQLHAGRRVGMSGPEPIGHFDLLAWAALTDSQPRVVEVHAIMALDRAFLDHIAKREKQP